MKSLLIVILFLSFNGFAQTKYITKTGTVNFEASVPLFEEVAAINNSVTAIINIENGEFAALALVKAFRFKNALMEEHFNENYAESNKFPKATFEGKIDDFSKDFITPSNKPFKIVGQLTFHGVTRKIDNCVATITRTEKGILMQGNFKVLASDFDIKIPSVVKSKVSNDIVVSFRFELSN